MSDVRSIYKEYTREISECRKLLDELCQENAATVQQLLLRKLDELEEMKISMAVNGNHSLKCDLSELNLRILRLLFEHLDILALHSSPRYKEHCHSFLDNSVYL